MFVPRNFSTFHFIELVFMLILSKVLVNAPQLLRFRGRWPLSLRPCSRTGNLSLEGEEMVFPSVVKDRFLSVSISFGYRS